MDDDFDDLIDDALDAPHPREDDTAILPPDWEDDPPRPRQQQSQLTVDGSAQSPCPAGVPADIGSAASQSSAARILDPASHLITPTAYQPAMQTPAPLLVAQSQAREKTVRTIDLAAELMAMATTDGPSQASNHIAPTCKRPRECTDADQISVSIEEKPIKLTREFRPLASHNAAMMPTPEFVQQERMAAQPRHAGPQAAKQARDNHVFRSLNAAQAGGTKCILIRGTSATDSVYCRMRPLWAPPKWWKPGTRASSHLLGTSIHTLLNRIEDEDIARTRTALQQLQEGDQTAGHAEEGASGRGAQAGAPAAEATSAARMLWVARHAPRSYLQLLSAEAVNSSVLRWLKAWDSVVFGAADMQVLAAARGHDDRRPEVKGILLSGPPGVGKTTLAHVAARHCGYRVVEINASDERSRGALVGAINSAVQMQAVLGEKRPNCLVIDEIDGALGDGSSGGASGVRELANILRTGRISSADKGPAYETTGGKKGKGSAALMRPIICICNDLYAPALRPLREAAEVVEVLPPQPRVLQARLREVCNREGAAVQETALKTLASKAAGDVRSCINTLQMLSARHGTVTGAHVSEVAVGDKDMTAAPFEMWGKLLSSRPARPSDMLTHLMCFGEHDLIMRGVHENMLEVPYMDQDLGRTVAMCDWMCNFDACSTKVFRKQHFTLVPLLPVSTLAVCNLCQTHSKVRLRWPKTATTVTKRTNATRSALADWVSTLPAPVATFSLTSAALEIAPAVSAALAPPQDTLDGLLLGRPKDPAAVQALVDHMLDYKVVYDLGAGQRLQGAPIGAEEAPVNGTPLKPPLHALHAYDSSWMNTKFTLHDAVRAMLLHKRQMQETDRQEQRAAEKAAQQAQHAHASGKGAQLHPPSRYLTASSESSRRARVRQEAHADLTSHAPSASGEPVHGARDSHMHECDASDVEALQQPSEAGAGGGVGDSGVAQAKGKNLEGGLRSFFKVPGAKAPAAVRPSHAAAAGTDACAGGSVVTQTQVRGAAGQAAAAIRGAKAPSLVNVKGNWLTSMGSKVMKQRQRRMLVADGHELKLPEGVTASTATGKLHFAVTFKFNEGYTNAVKRPLRMYDVFPGMGVAQ